MPTVRAAMDMVNQCRRLPVMLETFLGAHIILFQVASVRLSTNHSEDMRKNYYLINREVSEHLAQYEVCNDNACKAEVPHRPVGNLKS